MIRSQVMTIAEVVAATKLPTSTLRFYERKGLLPEPVRAANGYRVYDESTQTRLHFIKVAQAAGLTLAEIRSIVDLREDGTVPCTHVAALIDHKLADVQERIRGLTALQAELEGLAERSRVLNPADCADSDICHILSTANQWTHTG